MVTGWSIGTPAERITPPLHYMQHRPVEAAIDLGAQPRHAPAAQDRNQPSPTLASPAQSPLQHIFHLDRLAHVARDREAGRFEAGRSDGDRRIARKAEAFRRHEYRLVHLVVRSEEHTSELQSLMRI